MGQGKVRMKLVTIVLVSIFRNFWGAFLKDERRVLVLVTNAEPGINGEIYSQSI